MNRYGWIVSSQDRYLSDQLFELGFQKLAKGEYHEGLRLLRTAAGADRFKIGFEQGSGDYSPSTGLSGQIQDAARGLLDENGEWSAVPPRRPDPAALVFVGAEEEFKGFIERRTGISPDYRAQGFINHLGQAISRYRAAEQLGYPVATWRLDALRLKLGSEDFRHAETSYNQAKARSLAHSDNLRNQILGQLDRRQLAQQQTPVRWALIQDAARADRNQGVRASVHRAEERFRDGYLGPTAWFFSDGAWNFVALIDNKLVAASPDHAAELPAEDPITFKTTTSGSVRSVTIGPVMMLDPRPKSEVERLLALAVADVSDAGETRETLPSEAAFDSPMAIPPRRGSEEVEVPAGVGTVRDALVQLEELRSTALITEQEYAAKRTEILGRL